ncbi:MAG: glycine cleavage system aminomethyltransferase GcvT [Candidatus Omnitrophica bacterium]|jgi:aminomethyltransferase|nr:glycine cleavage system aminomethyltransferase GcvT [Candidatus Omnitrophota bacterium]
MEIKRTPLFQRHIQSRAHLVDFAGWSLPLDYGSILEETKAVRDSCGIFDASHMGEIFIEGKKTFDFFQRLTPNDITQTTYGQMQYNLFLNSSGGIIDDFMSYNLGNKILCVVNASNKDKVLNWLCQNSQEDVKIIDKSNQLALIAIQGPNSAELARIIFGDNIFNLSYMHFQNITLKGEEFLISRSGYTGEDGFEIYTSWDQAISIWDKIVEAGKKLNLALCGLGARDILRIEAGYPLYGHEIDDNTNPYEASLDWAVKLNKNFISKEALKKTLESADGKKRIGFIMLERAFPRQGYRIYVSGKCLGQVTSGVFSPNLNGFIGMAYLEKKYCSLDREVNIEIRDKRYLAKVVKFPFLKLRTKAKAIKGGIR